MKRAWKEEEESKLIELKNKNHTISQIASILNRSSKSVESKIWLLKQYKRL
jgi:hypothetical protein